MTNRAEPGLSAPVRRLRPGLPVLRRDLTSWQVGIDPATAVVVRHADDDTARALRALDPWHHPGADPQDVTLLPDRLLAGLAAHDVLADDRPFSARAGRDELRGRHQGDGAAAALARTGDPFEGRRAATVVVSGAGPVATLVATGLAYAGVGTVVSHGPRRPVRLADLTPAGPYDDDLGRPWAEATAAAVRRLGAATTAVDGAPVDLAVLTDAADADAPWCDPVLGDRWLRSGTAHLAVTVAGRGGEVGAIVVPGRTGCLHCRELARTDADPQWAALAVGLRRAAVAGVSDAPVALAVSLSLVAAALAVARVLAQLGDDDDPGGGEDLVLRLPGTVVGRRPAGRHPACGCGWGGGLSTMGG